jgi:ribonuclease HII
MILSGCLIHKSKEKELEKLGVKDSKQLTQKRREFLAEKINEIAEVFEIVVTHPEELDNNLNNGTNLNILEANKMAELVNRINDGVKKIKVVVDCPSIGLVKWQDYFKTQIENLANLEIFCEHKADQNHIAVGAASILAKCKREEEMDRLREKYGKEIGSGYTSDPKTQEFLKKNLEKFDMDGIFRKTWKTYKKALEENNQKKLI